MYTPELELNSIQIYNSQWSSVTPIYGISSSLRQAQRKVNELSKLPENWDTYGSSPPRPAAIEKALRILSLVNRQGFVFPQIFPVSGGGLQLEWQSETRELELEILPTGVMEYLIVDEQRIMKEGSLPTQDDFSIYRLIEWVK